MSYSQRLLLSHVKLFDRCAAALGSLLRLFEMNCFHERSVKYARRLQRILQGSVENSEIHKSVQDLKSMESVFTRLREILRLERADVYK